MERLARYIMRPPISLERMRVGRGGGGALPAQGRAQETRVEPGEREVETFDPLEFLARVIMHIPEPRRHLVRYYGWYSNVSRGKRRKGRDGKAQALSSTTRRRLSADRDRDARRAAPCGEAGRS